MLAALFNVNCDREEARSDPRPFMAVRDRPASVDWAQFSIDTKSQDRTRRLWVKVDIADWDGVMRHTWHISNDGRLRYPMGVIYGDDGFYEISLGRFLLGWKGDLGTLGRVHYRNGNGLDCRRENLVLATQDRILAQRRPSGGVSRYKGVAWDGAQRKWQAAFRGQRIGRFNTEEEAARAFDDAAKAYWGPDVYLNFPDPPRGQPMTPSAARLLQFAVRQCLNTEPFQLNPRAADLLEDAAASVSPWANLPVGWWDTALDATPQLRES